MQVDFKDVLRAMHRQAIKHARLSRKYAKAVNSQEGEWEDGIAHGGFTPSRSPWRSAASTTSRT